MSTEEFDPSCHSAGQPIVAGWAYQFVAQLGFERDSWVAPVDIRRVGPEERVTTTKLVPCPNVH